MVERVNHELLQLLLSRIVDHQGGLLEPLQLILPLFCLHFDETSVKLLKFAFNPLRKSLAKFGSNEPELIQWLQIILDDFKLSKLSIFDSEQALSLVDERSCPLYFVELLFQIFYLTEDGVDQRGLEASIIRANLLRQPVEGHSNRTSSFSSLFLRRR